LVLKLIAMRINNKTYPIYLTLLEGSAYDVQFDADLAKYLGLDKGIRVAQAAIETMRMGVKQGSVKYVSDAFLKVLEETSDKLSEAMDKDNASSNSLYECSVFMHRIGFIMHRVLDTMRGKVCQYFMMNRTGITGYLEYELENVDENKKSFGYLSGHHTDNTAEILQYFRTYIMLLYFIDKCDIESTLVKPKQKVRIDGQKFYNEYGKGDIQVLDAKWYRELIINCPFGVNGHLRFQPYGEGRTKRKLIWIAAYQKQGYHRKAKAEYHGQES